MSVTYSRMIQRTFTSCLGLIAGLSLFAGSASAASNCSLEEKAFADAKKALSATIAKVLKKPNGRTRRARMLGVIKYEEDLNSQQNSARKRVISAEARLKSENDKLAAALQAIGITDFDARFPNELINSRQRYLLELQNLEAAAYQGGYLLCSSLPLCAQDITSIRSNTRWNAFYLDQLITGGSNESQAYRRTMVNTTAAALESADAVTTGTILICSMDSRCASDAQMRDALIRSVDLLNALEEKSSWLGQRTCDSLAKQYRAELHLSPSSARRLEDQCDKRERRAFSLKTARQRLQTETSELTSLSSAQRTARQTALKALGVRSGISKFKNRKALLAALEDYKVKREAKVVADKARKDCGIEQH